MMQAKDINDVDFLRLVADIGRANAPDFNARTGMDEETVWVFRWDLQERLPNVPDKVIRAKAKSLIRRGLMEGCTCGCRGDFELTSDGEAVLFDHGVLRFDIEQNRVVLVTA